MRTPTAVAVLVLSGLAWIGVPSAAADELPPTSAETSAVTAPADEPAPAPTPEASDVPTSEVTAPEPEEIATSTEDAAEPTDGETAATADEPTAEPAEAAVQTSSAEETDTQTVGGDGAALAGKAGVAAETLAAAEPVLDPHASIGEVSCTTLTVPVTLDNYSVSGEAVTFRVRALRNGQDFFLETVEVPAFASRIVNVPVTEETYISVTVHADFLLTSATFPVDCSDDEIRIDPQARIGELGDCLSVDVTLDNSRSEDEVQYRVQQIFVEEQYEFLQDVTVPAGAVQTVALHFSESSTITVSVTYVEDFVPIAELAYELFRTEFDCSDEPRALIGEVNCKTLTVPVTLVNRSPLTATFSVSVEYGDSYRVMEFFVAGNSVRVVPVPVPNRRVSIYAEHPGYDYLAFASFEVDCRQTAARPTVAVKGAKFSQTGEPRSCPKPADSTSPSRCSALPSSRAVQGWLACPGAVDSTRPSRPNRDRSRPPTNR